MAKILVVGGVGGGAACATRLRRLDEHAEIILFERGEYISFANCGLPYYISGEIQDRDDLLVATPAFMKKRYNLDVRNGHCVTRIDREQQRLEVQDVRTGRTYQESYDQLVLAPGAQPVRLPIPGMELPNVFTLRTIPDTDRIKARLQAGARSAIVFGAGFIAIEMAEALQKAGLHVTVAQRSRQILSMLDPEVAAVAQKELQHQGVTLQLGNPVLAFQAHGHGLRAELRDGTRVDADMAIVATGVKPEVDLATAAGLAIGAYGGITVDTRMRTSDPRIFAVGDAVESLHAVTGHPTLMTFAGPATKQARVAADVICGRDSEYSGSVNTFILRVFDLAVGSTGCTAKELRHERLPHQACHVHPNSHASYFPGATALSIKLLFRPDDGRILGAQAVGKTGVDKCLNALATAVAHKLTVFDLEKVDYAYAPPFGSAKDPVNYAAFVAANILRGDVEKTDWQELEDAFDPARDLIVDVRTAAEYAKGSVPGARNVPVDDLRSRLHELPKDRTLHLYCGVGLRSYIATRILKQHGFTVRNLSGGFTTYRHSVTSDRFTPTP